MMRNKSNTRLDGNEGSPDLGEIGDLAGSRGDELKFILNREQLAFFPFLSAADARRAGVIL